MMNEQRASVVSIVETTIWPCEADHSWQPTIIIGYFQCIKCDALAACRICAPKLRGKPLVGVCQKHRHLAAQQAGQEVLS